MNDVIINKVQSIQRCISRAREEYRLAGDKFRSDFTRQDAAILNVVRACEQSIDLANNMLKSRKLGIPTSSSEGFSLLARNNLIPEELAERLKEMVHFRNLVVHQYQAVNMEILEWVLREGYEDLVAFTKGVVAVETRSE